MKDKFSTLVGTLAPPQTRPVIVGESSLRMATVPETSEEAILRYLRESGSARTSRQICDAIDISYQTAYVILNRLCLDKGTVSREKVEGAFWYSFTPIGNQDIDDRIEAQQPIEIPQPSLAAGVDHAPAFRCGMFSDGSLRLEGDFSVHDGHVVIGKGETRHLIDYLRRLDALSEQSA